jgi:hypothetical protein
MRTGAASGLPSFVVWGSFWRLGGAPRKDENFSRGCSPVHAEDPMIVAVIRFAPFQRIRQAVSPQPDSLLDPTPPFKIEMGGTPAT